MIDDQPEYEIEKILRERATKEGRKEYPVKWRGYCRPTWETTENVEDTVALEDFLGTKELEG